MTDHLYPPEDDEPDNFEPSLADYAAALEEMERTEAEPAPPQIAPIPLFQMLFERTATDEILQDFAHDVVGKLSDELGMKSAKGGKFYREKLAAGAKNAERYGRDQSLRAHLMNGMLPALRIARCLKAWGASRFRQYWTPEIERLFIAGFMMHDYGKIDEVQQTLKDLGFADNAPPREDQIAALERVFEQWCERLGLDDFLAPIGGLSLYVQDLISIAHNTQQLWGTLPDSNSAIDLPLVSASRSASYLNSSVYCLCLPISWLLFP